PSVKTILHLTLLLFLSPSAYLNYNPSFNYFVRLFKDSVQKYLELLTTKTKPKKIIVCMIYYPCTVYSESSWSKTLLSLSGYDKNPSFLQYLIKSLFEYATKQIKIDGTKIIPVGLFNILDANNPKHYVQR